MSRLIWLRSGEDSLAERCRGLSEQVAILSKEESERQPERLQEVEVVYGWLSPQQWPSTPALKWLQLTGAGANSLLTPEVTQSPVVITNVSGIHAAPITEHMFGLLLAYNRKLFGARQRQAEARWSAEGLGDNLPILEGQTLGVLGVGRIGAHSARVGKAFGMKVIGLRRSGRPHPDVERMYPLPELHAFLAESDVVMNTLPLTPATEKMIGPAEVAAMKVGSIFINTGRGGTVDTDALVEGLRSGRPGAALLDVTDPEPLPSGHPLWKMENVVITPHYSGAHARYGERAAAIFLKNLERYLKAEPLFNVVDKEAGY